MGPCERNQATPQGGCGENELIEGCGHGLAGCHHNACQQAAGWLFFWVCSQSWGGWVPGRVFPLFGKCHVHLASSAACGLSTEQLPCPWVWTPRGGSAVTNRICWPWKRQPVRVLYRSVYGARLTEPPIRLPCRYCVKVSPTGMWTWPVDIVSGRTVGNGSPVFSGLKGYVWQLLYLCR